MLIQAAWLLLQYPGPGLSLYFSSSTQCLTTICFLIGKIFSVFLISTASVFFLITSLLSSSFLFVLLFSLIFLPCTCLIMLVPLMPPSCSRWCVFLPRWFNQMQWHLQKRGSLLSQIKDWAIYHPLIRQDRMGCGLAVGLQGRIFFYYEVDPVTWITGGALILVCKTGKKSQESRCFSFLKPSIYQFPFCLGLSGVYGIFPAIYRWADTLARMYVVWMQLGGIAFLQHINCCRTSGCLPLLICRTWP